MLCSVITSILPFHLSLSRICAGQIAFDNKATYLNQELQQLPSIVASVYAFHNRKDQLIQNRRYNSEMDPGDVYLKWLKSRGGEISDSAVSHAQSLRQEPLSKHQEEEHKQRIQYLKDLERTQGSFAHYTVSESRHHICSSLVTAALRNDGMEITEDQVANSQGLCTAFPIHRLAVDSTVGNATSERLGNEEWQLVYSLEPAVEPTEKALAEEKPTTGEQARRP